MAGFVAAAALAIVGTGSAAGSMSAPTPDGLPGNVVAAVSEVPPRLGRITETEFREALVEQSAAAGLSAVPKPGGKGYERLEEVALEERLDAVWIQGQAMEMDIGVTRREVNERALASANPLRCGLRD